MKGTCLDIARTRILIHPDDLFKAFHPLESSVIKPFIKSRYRQHDCSADIRIINDHRYPHKSMLERITGKPIKSLLSRRTRPRGFSRKALITNKRALLIFDGNTRHCDVYYRTLKIAPALEDIYYQKWFYNLLVLKLLLRNILNVNGLGAVLHASSIEHNGRGYVFVGHSGAGKSTVTRLLKPDRMLSDDTTVVRWTGRNYQLFTNPWWNGGPHIRIQNPERPAPLKALFFIKKADRTCLARLDPVISLKKIIASDVVAPQLGFSSDSLSTYRFCVFCRELLKHVPCFELSVRKSAVFKKEFAILLHRHRL